MNFFKRIWNFIRPEKKEIVIGNVEPFESKVDVFIESKTIEHKVEQPKPQTQLFRNQQLPGKVYNIGKSCFRINKKLTETADGRLKYIITKLI